MKHFTKEELELYRNNEMSFVRRISCAAHLKECPACTRLLEELEAEDVFVNELRTSLRLFDELSLPCRNQASHN